MAAAELDGIFILKEQSEIALRIFLVGSFAFLWAGGGKSSAIRITTHGNSPQGGAEQLAPWLVATNLIVLLEGILTGIALKSPVVLLSDAPFPRSAFYLLLSVFKTLTANQISLNWTQVNWQTVRPVTFQAFAPIFPNTFCVLFTRWIGEKNPQDLGCVPSGAPGFCAWWH